MSKSVPYTIEKRFNKEELIEPVKVICNEQDSLNPNSYDNISVILGFLGYQKWIRSLLFIVFFEETGRYDGERIYEPDVIQTVISGG